MTTQAHSELNIPCHIIPVEAGNLLLPEHLVAEIVMLEDTDTQESLVWRNRTIPIIDTNSRNKLTTRVAVIKAVMGYQGLPYIGIATNGIPYPLTVNPDLLSELTEEGQTCDIAASYVKVGNLDCIVPDLPKVERRTLNRANVST